MKAIRNIFIAYWLLIVVIAIVGNWYFDAALMLAIPAFTLVVINTIAVIIKLKDERKSVLYFYLIVDLLLIGYVCYALISVYFFFCGFSGHNNTPPVFDTIHIDTTLVVPAK